jgi:predicted RNA-binding Zn ribbon-like protein
VPKTDSAPPPPARIFRLISGALCLDFCNTLGGKRGAVVRECLDSYSELISWSRQAGLITGEQASELLRKGSRRGQEAAEVLSRALQLREAIYRMLMDHSHGKTAKPADLAIINAELSRLLPRRQIVSKDSCCDWAWADVEALDFPLGPIAHSAAELLTSHARPRLHQCEGDNCGWLFLDSSKNHSRRWCDMRDCGNRAKVRRHRSKAAT